MHSQMPSNRLNRESYINCREEIIPTRKRTSEAALHGIFPPPGTYDLRAIQQFEEDFAVHYDTAYSTSAEAGTAHHSPNSIDATLKTTNQSTTSSQAAAVYYAIPRPWQHKQQQEQDSRPPNPSTNPTTNSPALERWARETAQDQPWNGTAAVSYYTDQDQQSTYGYGYFGDHRSSSSNWSLDVNPGLGIHHAGWDSDSASASASASDMRSERKSESVLVRGKSMH